MKKLALVAAVAGLAALPACTTVNPQRRTLTDWNLSEIKETKDPCGNMSPETKMNVGKGCGGNVDGSGRGFVNAVFVKPIQFVMLPISWLGDTLIVNPIDGWKKAELDTHTRRFCKADPACQPSPEWTDAHAAHHAYGAIPVATPWIVSEALAAPEFAARWIWNCVAPVDPVNQEAYEAYWRAHNETTGQ